mgnify:CR=1 FL=1
MNLCFLGVHRGRLPHGSSSKEGLPKQYIVHACTEMFAFEQTAFYIYREGRLSMPSLPISKDGQEEGV